MTEIKLNPELEKEERTIPATEEKELQPEMQSEIVAGINLSKLQDKMNIINLWKRQHPKAEMEEIIKFIKINCGLTEEELIFMMIDTQNAIMKIRGNIMSLINV